MSVAQALVLAAEVVLGVAAVLAAVRIVRGPTLLDRMVASDVLLTTLMIVLALLTATRGTIAVPAVLVLAGTASLGTVAVARSVSGQDRRAGVAPEQPLAAREEEP